MHLSAPRNNALPPMKYFPEVPSRGGEHACLRVSPCLLLALRNVTLLAWLPAPLMPARLPGLVCRPHSLASLRAACLYRDFLLLPLFKMLQDSFASFLQAKAFCFFSCELGGH